MLLGAPRTGAFQDLVYNLKKKKQCFSPKDQGNLQQAMFTERVGAVELISRPEGRVALAGTLLAFLQV